MLRKLLKYDLRAVFRVWWLAAAISLVMALVGGGALYVRANENFFPDELYTLSGVVVFFVFFSLAALMILTLVLIFMRLYSNFFTDEGYLTFTLPVHRLQLVNAKLITGVLAILATGAVVTVDLAVMYFLRDPEQVFSPHFWRELETSWQAMQNTLGNYLWVYALEFLVFGLLATVCTVLFLYTCISFAAMIVKKGKLIAAIGIYYGFNSLVATLMQLFLIFGLNSLLYWAEPLTTRQALSAAAIILLGLICFVGMFCGLLYGLLHYFVDRKLNLS